IEVTGAPEDERPEIQETSAYQPRYVRFGIDIDAPSPAAVVPDARPVASRGEEWADRLPAYALEAETYWSHSPAQLWQRLRDEPASAELSDMEIWDLVAWIWAQQTTAEALSHAEEVYAQEGAAAHGETGHGDGVMVEGLSPYSYDFREDGHRAIQPPDLTVDAHTFGASPARLEGKMLRGGMGTGMPAYGEIYTPEEIEALVAYFYTFVMDLDAAPGSTP
ncbi:MAG: cytochrome c, partial [Anaerolineae bacterium]|nr:cytochrome c [Anaerolineae bacterium]